MERNCVSNIEKMLVDDLVCIPIDQRLDEKDIQHIIKVIDYCL